MKGRKRRRRSLDVRRMAAQVFMMLASLTLVAPLIWMASTSLKPKAEVLSADPKWIPSPATISNFSELFARSEEFPVLRWLFNSFLISCSVTMLVLLVTSMAAFAFARLKFRGRDILFMIVISTMIIPGQVILIPAFLIVQKLGWFNSYFGLIVPGAAGAFGVFLLRQFFRSIPVELEEAAVADGAGLWTIYLRIILPLAKPALATLAIFTFMGSWNDFVWPLIVTNEISMRTLPVGLMIFQGRYNMEYGITMAAAMICSLPVIIAFIIFQKRITEGIALTGIKG